jgi:hypothetical protein
MLLQQVNYAILAYVTWSLFISEYTYVLAVHTDSYAYSVYVDVFSTQTISNMHVTQTGPGSSVGIATGYWLDGPGIESRWGRDFSHTSRPAHPASCTMGTGSFSGRDDNHPPILAPRSRKSRAIPLLPLWTFGSVTGFLYLLLFT